LNIVTDAPAFVSGQESGDRIGDQRSADEVCLAISRSGHYQLTTDH
jgi:hypothetical protein